jgi:hypothetical protein
MRTEIKTGAAMKTFAGTVKQALLVVAVVSIFAMLAFAQNKTGKVTIGQNVIILHPGTKLSRPDQKALNAVLKKYDKSLYKIDNYQNGEKKTSQGQLSDVCLDRAVVAEVAAAKGNSNRTLQVIAATNPQRGTGSTTNPQRSPGSPTNPLTSPSPGSPTNPLSSPGSPTNPLTSPSPGSPTNPLSSPGSSTNPLTSPPPTNPLSQKPCVSDEKAAKELIERLKPILEKYSKQ